MDKMADRGDRKNSHSSSAPASEFVFEIFPNFTGTGSQLRQPLQPRTSTDESTNSPYRLPTKPEVVSPGWRATSDVNGNQPEVEKESVSKMPSWFGNALKGLEIDVGDFDEHPSVLIISSTSGENVKSEPEMTPVEQVNETKSSAVDVHPDGISSKESRDRLGDKPVIADVRLFRPSAGAGMGRTPTNRAVGGSRLFRQSSRHVPTTGESRSSDAIHQLDVLSGFKNENKSAPFRPRERASTFVKTSADGQSTLVRKSLYIDLGEYQTLIRRTSESGDETGSEKSPTSPSDTPSENHHRLPQALAQGEDTLKAVHLITQKFDSFRRMQMRVNCFRQASMDRKQSDGNCTSGRETTTSALRAAEELFSQSEDDDVDATTAGNPEVDGGITRKDLDKVRLFYDSCLSNVHVCRSLADMFVGACAATRNPDDSASWIHAQTGIPVLLLNTGSGTRRRELILILAHRRTGFSLWQDRITYMSDYREVAPGVHALRVSGSLTKCVRLSIWSEAAAAEFLERFRELTSNPDDELWKMSYQEPLPSHVNQHQQPTEDRKKATSPSVAKKAKDLRKSGISAPCNPRHVTRVELKDPDFRSAFGNLLPANVEQRKTTEICHAEEETRGAHAQIEDFRPRLPTN